MERRRKVIFRSFSLAKDMYLSGGGRAHTKPAEQRDLDAGAEFLEVINKPPIKRIVRIRE